MPDEKKRIAVIIGAGPAGLTAAYELVRRTNYRPVVIEAADDVGGISKTMVYNGNRIDFGGHRFFSKSDRVMKWWLNILPLQKIKQGGKPLTVSYQNNQRNWLADEDGPDPDKVDDVMLVRSRVSRILYDGKLFNYPLSLSVNTILKLGLLNTFCIGLSYLRAMAWPIKPEVSLEDFFINRFGRRLYSQFFEDYTEKVWGVPCREIAREWGAQRVKGLSIVKLITHAIKQIFGNAMDLAQRKTETSLIERFFYPKLGPGLMWQRVADRVREGGGEIRFNEVVCGLIHKNNSITDVEIRNRITGEKQIIKADVVISTMPVRELMQGLEPTPPAAVRAISDGLVYRDFLVVGLLLDRLKFGGGTTAENLSNQLPDNWIYVQEPNVKIGRIQIFNNWSPYLVADPSKIWIGLEYFCNAGDALWTKDDKEMLAFAVEEGERINLFNKSSVCDGVVARMPKAYPAYFGTYNQFDTLRNYLDTFENLYLVGRNGMHRYNNQDHSMLTAMMVIDGLEKGTVNRAAIWSINTEEDYHEEK